MVVQTANLVSSSAHCPEVIVILDSIKLGRVALASFASIEQISHVITDDGVDPVLMQKLRDRGVEVFIA